MGWHMLDFLSTQGGQPGTQGRITSPCLLTMVKPQESAIAGQVGNCGCRPRCRAIVVTFLVCVTGAVHKLVVRAWIRTGEEIVHDPSKLLPERLALIFQAGARLGCSQ